MAKKHDAVVVGGGHNGLVAATYLAKAGKSVLLLEKSAELGGATASVRAFPEFDAQLSRYSYLVSLLPDQIVSDLGINFHTIDRTVSSHTPYIRNGQHESLTISTNWDSQTAASFLKLTGSDEEAATWQNFYAEILEFAKIAAPMMLQPLMTRSQMRKAIDMDHIWEYLIERPIGEVIEARFKNDLVRGVILTDALIGTFVDAFDIQANICFLYHLIGNGTGQWKVPRGGMGALVLELERVARAAGVDIRLSTGVISIKSGAQSVLITSDDGFEVQATDLLFAAAPQELARLRNSPPPKSLPGAQIKINMLLTRLPRLKSGVDPRIAFAGTFHLHEEYSNLNQAFHSASNQKMPERIPFEMYCHTLADQSILSQDLIEQGFHTLTLFALQTDASLFDSDPESIRDSAVQKILASLNEYLADPIESVLAKNSDGTFALEAKSPLDLEAAIGLPRGNIFHKDLDFPFLEDGYDLEHAQWGAETDDPHIFIAGAGARRGGGVSAIAGHNAAMAVLAHE